jgi:hypothetical protein
MRIQTRKRRTLYPLPVSINFVQSETPEKAGVQKKNLELLQEGKTRNQGRNKSEARALYHASIRLTPPCTAKEEANERFRFRFRVKVVRQYFNLVNFSKRHVGCMQPTLPTQPLHSNCV